MDVFTPFPCCRKYRLIIAVHMQSNGNESFWIDRGRRTELEKFTILWRMTQAGGSLTSTQEGRREVVDVIAGDL